MATIKSMPNPATTAEAKKEYAGLTAEQLVQVYRIMYMSRRIDDREILLKRQQKIYFQLSGAGHEALLVGSAMALKPGYDWFYAYYRDRALSLQLGITAYDMFAQALGNQDDHASGGRQMPSHWTSKRLNVVTPSSPTGTQFLQAVGCAEAGKYFAQNPEAAKSGKDDYRQFKDVTFHGDEVTYVSTGEGATSEGEFWEAINYASNNKLPVFFLCEDNEYAISVPVEIQTPGGNISRLLTNFPNLYIEEVDGTDPIASYAASKRCVDYCRSGKGAAFLHGHVVRPYSHSLSDDEKLYRPEAERNLEVERDPITRFRALLIKDGILKQSKVEELEHKIDEELQDAVDRCLPVPIPAPTPETVNRYIYSPHLDIASSTFASEPAFPNDDSGKSLGGKTMADLINACLRDELKRDNRILLFGEDVADCSREEYLKNKEVKGKGGVFKLTSGLQCEYGGNRVFNAPIAEASIVGRAVGMAERGLKPVVEIQFFDYIWPAMHQLRNEVPVIRWRSNNEFSCPMVVRVAIGGYLTGGGIYHSQCGESIFTHIPGLRVAFPSNALDANGLLRTAIRCDDPVLFLEHKRLYRETYGRSAYPGPDYMIPFGKAKVVQEGSDLSVITYGALVPRTLQAAQRLQQDHGIKAEIIDLRSLSPYDWEAIAESVRKTNRVLVAYEDVISFGYGAEIAARIADELFDSLDAPVRRVAAMDSFCAYQPALEDVILPQPEDVYQAMKKLAEY